MIGEAQYRGKKTVQLHANYNDLSATDFFSADVDGKNVLYGTVSDGVDTYYDPVPTVPFSLPLNQPHINGVDRQTPSNQSMTYSGRVTLKTVLDTFETCRFDYKNLDSGYVWTEWIVATGKLQGLMVQWASGTVVTQPTRIAVSW